MLFNSLEFAFFFVIVYSLYLVIAHKWQNRLLLVASYFFYGWWDWRFLGLIFVSTLVDFLASIKIHQGQKEIERKTFLILSVCVNLGILGFFKYFNFFVDNFEALMRACGWRVDPILLNIVLPVGISFYTFQSMSYTIDVYRRRLSPTQSFLDYALFVSFFPQLVAGPIERAWHLLPQVLHPRTLDREKVMGGLALMAWGLFKKVVIADNMARIVNAVFEGQGPVNGAHVVLAIYAFAVQIYSDFSGYSDIARGLGKMMGFDIMLNFNLPYFAKNVQEFWRRWHISLSTWLRDYLYIPLGGNRKGKVRTYVNLMITMGLGGLWHGATWAFVIWGLFHGVLLSIQRFFTEKRPSVTDSESREGILVSAAKILFTFHLVCLGWLLFRSNSLAQAGRLFGSIFLNSSWDWQAGEYLRQFLFYSLGLALVQIIQHARQSLDSVYRAPALVKICLLAFFASVVTISASVGLPEAREFIYFQF